MYNNNMNFKDYIFILKLKGVPTEAVKACEPFVNKQMSYGKITANPKYDLGFAELGIITDKEQSIGEIVNAIWSSCFDCDALGRDTSKKAYKQMCANPHKHFARVVLKSYYLHYHNISEEPQFAPNDITHLIKTNDVETLYRLNAFKDYA